MKKIKELETDCRQYPYLWESTKLFGLNKDVTAEHYESVDDVCYETQPSYPMMNLEIQNYKEMGELWGDSYGLKLWWKGDFFGEYESDSRSVIKSMFYSGVKFLHKRLEKDNLTFEDIEKAYDDCADMLEKRYIIEDKRAKLINASRQMGKRINGTFWTRYKKHDLRKYRTWTDEQILERIEKDKLNANKLKEIKK